MKKKIKLTIFLIILFLSLILLISLLGKQITEERDIVRLGYIEHAAELPVYVALEKGFFEEQNLKIELIPLGYKEEMDALIREDIDIIPATSMSLPLGVEGQDPGLIKIFHLGGIPSEDKEVVGAVVALEESLIYSLNDLKGKRVGVSSGVVDLFVMKTVLKKIGLDPIKEVDIIEMKKEILPLALNSKQVDALYITQPGLAILMSQTKSRIVVKNPRAKYIFDPFWSGCGVVTSSFIKERATDFEKYLKAVDKAIDYIDQNPIESKKFLAIYTPLEENLTSKMGMYFKIKATEEINLFQVQQIVDTFFELGALKTKVNVANLYLSPEEIKNLKK